MLNYSFQFPIVIRDILNNNLKTTMDIELRSNMNTILLYNIIIIL